MKSECNCRILLAAVLAASSVFAAPDAVRYSAPAEKLPAGHTWLVAYDLMDQTDRHDELVQKREWLVGSKEKTFEIATSVFAFEDAVTGKGSAFVRLAPLPHARINTNADVRIDVRVERNFEILSNGYPYVRLDYAGGRVGRTKALQDFQRRVRPFVDGRDGLFLSNTWGDHNSDSRIEEKFLLGEVAAAEKLGIEVLQIDDGWQTGKSSNSAFANGKGVWNGYWAANPNFWVPDPKRFPSGFRTVTDAAAKAGLRFGLWFAPDSSNDAANWKRDADWLLKLHREYGIDYFKLDSMKTLNATCLERQRALFDRLLNESQKKIVVDLDVTAERRPGYFGLMDAGPVFVENRYTDNHSYWPHLTLRALWSLAEVVDPIRLRMEVPNPRRNADKYAGDPLAPGAYPVETVFAIAMPASPLGWFEVQNLDPATVAAWKPLVARWKRERAGMAACNVIPVGAKPDGYAWTGFVFAPRAKGGDGYALLFRELSPSATFAYDFGKAFPDCETPVVLSPRGSATLDGVSVALPLDFVWVKFPAKKPAGAAAAPAAKSGGKIPTLGYQLDVSRDKVPTMDALRHVVDTLAALGYGQLQLYTEHTFAYKGHESAWAEASPMTPDEIRTLDGWCAEKGIELVPNQNSFGHMEHWLCHPEYRPLAEAPNLGVKDGYGRKVMQQSAICPTDPRSTVFLAGLYDQLLPCFRSKFFNVGCDEVSEVTDQPASRSAAEVKRRGGAQWVYTDFLNKIHGLVAARNHTMMYWADIVLNKPETIPSLPEDAIALDWGYEADHPFLWQTGKLKAAKRRFYVCPGTSAWCSLTGRVKNMMGNVDAAVEAGEKNGADGLLLADWGDGGHPQPWLVSVPALVYAAARVRGEKLGEAQLAAKIDALLGCRVGAALVDYGNLYLQTGKPLSNQTIIWRVVMRGKAYGALPEKTEPGVGMLSVEEANRVLAAWRTAQKKVDLRGAPAWVCEDLATMDLLMEIFEMRVNGRHDEIVPLLGPRYRALWLRQNRRGGLEASIRKNLAN